MHEGAFGGLVHGHTDSQLLFALIAAEIRKAGGDVGEGITRAIKWIARELLVFSLSMIVTTATDVGHMSNSHLRHLV